MGRPKRQKLGEDEEEKTDYEKERDARVKLLQESVQFRNVMQAAQSL